jgi:hypothetical protein
VGAELFHAGGQTDRRTDMTELIVAFRYSVKASESPLAATLIHRRVARKSTVP